MRGGSTAAKTAQPDKRDGFALTLSCGRAEALPSGALWLGDAATLVVSDLHLGKAERVARRGGPFLPPYEVAETLGRLEAEIARLAPAAVVCLGDSFDDAAAARALGEAAWARIGALAAGRRWIWVAGNHDPVVAAPVGSAEPDLLIEATRLRHIAAQPLGDVEEISGHFHPKALLSARGRRLRRRCFLWDGRRLILPAFGAYTGGLDAADAAFDRLLAPNAAALLCSDDAVRALPRRALLGAR